MSKTPVYTYNMGVAMSAAFLILISGHKRFATKNSTALVHSGSGGTQGTYEQTKAQMADYEHCVKVMREHVLAKTRISSQKFSKKNNIEWYMYADEQIENGVVDKILESVDEL
jgi:ATP-dependent Clp protease protease subunit